MNLALLASTEFVPPTTKDFSKWFEPQNWWLGPWKVGPFEFGLNFIYFLVLLALCTLLAFFFFAMRRPKVVPGKLQMVAEIGVDFVKENTAMSMIGPRGVAYMGLLTSLFFWILAGNIYEIVPGVNFSMNSRLAFPTVLALVAYGAYHAAGIRQHGFFGYLKHSLILPGVPMLLMPLMFLIEFITVFITRPLTLAVRLFANMVAGHFLLTVFFLGTIGMLFSGKIVLMVFSPFAGALAIALVGFELFVAGLQAFIFAVLTASYIGQSISESH